MRTKKETKVKYAFPETIFSHQNTIPEQLEHLFTEVEEIKEVVNFSTNLVNKKERFCEEVWDLLHSCETLLRMQELAGIDVGQVKNAVIAKNQKRKYYSTV